MEIAKLASIEGGSKDMSVMCYELPMDPKDPNFEFVQKKRMEAASDLFEHPDDLHKLFPAVEIIDNKFIQFGKKPGYDLLEANGHYKKILIASLAKQIAKSGQLFLLLKGEELIGIRNLHERNFKDEKFESFSPKEIERNNKWIYDKDNKRFVDTRSKVVLTEQKYQEIVDKVNQGESFLNISVSVLSKHQGKKYCKSAMNELENYLEKQGIDNNKIRCFIALYANEASKKLKKNRFAVGLLEGLEYLYIDKDALLINKDTEVNKGRITPTRMMEQNIKLNNDDYVSAKMISRIRAIPTKQNSFIL